MCHRTRKMESPLRCTPTANHCFFWHASSVPFDADPAFFVICDYTGKEVVG